MTRALPTLERHWGDLANYDAASVDVFAEATRPAFTAVKGAVLDQSTGFYSILSGRAVPVMNIAEIAVVPAVREPFISVWQAFKAGRSYADAVEAGRLRLDAVVVNLASSTARQAGDLFASKTGLSSRWRRTPDSGACDWCLLIAGQSYKTADSADFGHDRCKCTAIPDF